MDWKKLREDFPVLQRKIEGKRIIYFDNACMTLKPKQVIDAINYYYNYLSACGGGRSSHALSVETDELCENSRKNISRFIGCEKEEVIWVKNTTEGINLVAKTLNFKKGENVVCSILDHHSAILPFWSLVNKGRLKEIRIVEIENDYTIPIEKWEEKIDRKTKMVVINPTSNVTGTLMNEKDIMEIVKIAHENGAFTLIDGAQYVPHRKVDVKKLNVDFLSFSIHKMCGPTGLGVLYGKYDLLESLEPFIVGGETIRDVKFKNGKIIPEFLKPPQRFEAGLQNYASIIAVSSTVSYLERIGMENIERRDEELSKKMLEELKDVKGLKLIGPCNIKNRISLFSFVLEREFSIFDFFSLLNSSSEFIFALRVGQHCANPLHYFIGLDPSKGDGTLRASLYFYNTKEEIELFIEALKNTLKILPK